MPFHSPVMEHSKVTSGSIPSGCMKPGTHDAIAVDPNSFEEVLKVTLSNDVTSGGHVTTANEFNNRALHIFLSPGVSMVSLCDVSVSFYANQSRLEES